MVIYYACENCGLMLSSVSGGSFLSAGDLISLSGNSIGNYAIEWRQDSVDGSVPFTSGVGASDPNIQAQHPFTDEVVFAGTLYPVITYIYIDGNEYTSTPQSGPYYSPDLITCLSSVVITSIDYQHCFRHRSTISILSLL